MNLIKITFLSLFFTFNYFISFAQNCPDNFLGTKTLYVSSGVKGTAIPEGYTAAFINYVGRHGARHLTKEVKSSYAYQLLEKADSASALTQVGQKLKQMVLELEKVEKGNVKSISAEGQMELQGIGERIFNQNQPVFSQALRLKVSLTKEIRTKQSADAFLKGLTREAKKTPLITEVTDDTNLRFYDFAPAYNAFEQNGNWVPVMESLKTFENIKSINTNFIRRIFSTPFSAQLSPKQQDKFTTDIFGFATIVYSLQSEVLQAGIKPAELNFKSVFSCAELQHLGDIDAAEDFLTKGPGTNVNGIQVRIAVPLLINFIKTTDAFIDSNKYDAQLRFAHAETIAPFAALLGINTADEATKEISQINKKWQPSVVAPLSSNIQWILYKKEGTKDFLVKILLNEKEAQITGLESKTLPYYSWKDIREFYSKKLQDSGVKLNDNMAQYLKEIH